MKKQTERAAPASGRVSPLMMGLGGLGLVVCLGLGYGYLHGSAAPEAALAPPPAATRIGDDKLQLAPEQVHELNVGPVESRSFEVRREAIGIIDFNQDNAVQVFSPYQGRIGQLLVRAGDDVAKGQVLFTVQIPDLAAAASTLISAAGTLKTANETLQRAKSLYETQSIPLKELQQNSSDQQAADAAYRAAHKTLALFGLTEAEIGEVEKTRKVDTEMPVRSPFAGRVTARSGAPGQLVQPGANTATVTVANIQQLWMVANVPESEVAAYRLGQAVSVKVQAYPDQAFSGKVNYIADAADPNTHRVVVRAEVADRQHQLKPQMLATFTIQVGAPQKSPAVPANALARESDGSTSAWVTEDELRFVRRRVQTGLTQDGMVQITQGLTAGEKVARDKALFLSNLYLITSN